MDSKSATITRRTSHVTMRAAPEIPQKSSSSSDPYRIDIRPSRHVDASMDFSCIGYDAEKASLTAGQVALIQSEKPDFFGLVPEGVFNQIARYVDYQGIVAMTRVCKAWSDRLEAPIKTAVCISYGNPAIAEGPLGEFAETGARHFSQRLGGARPMSRAQGARLMRPAELVGVLRTKRQNMITESRRRDAKANEIHQKACQHVGRDLSSYIVGSMLNGIVWADLDKQGTAWSLPQLASCLTSGLPNFIYGWAVPGLSIQDARSQTSLMAGRVLNDVFRAVTTIGFDLAVISQQEESSSPARHIPTVLLVGCALIDAVVCGRAAWHNKQALQAKEAILDIDRKIAEMIALQNKLTQVEKGLRFTFKGIDEQINIRVEEVAPPLTTAPVPGAEAVQ